jgi:O-antigen/teichoic acid export membrane protein
MTATERHRSVRRNTILNMAGFGIPLVVGLAVMPTITSHLGPARFGLLGLTLALLEYSTLFNLGLGLATTKHVAEGLAKGDGRVSELVAGSVIGQVVLGVIGGAAFVLLAPFLAERLFVIPANLHAEAISVFRLLGLMIPATLLLVGLRGVLEAAHRFDLSNAVRIPSSLASFIIPAVAVSNGFTLVDVMVMLVITRFVFCGVMLVAVHRAIPSLAWHVPRDWAVFRPLVAFGGWLSVSNVVSPLLVYLDRFFLGALIGVAAVGFYSAPFDGVIRLLIVPGAMVAALFPSVSGLNATRATGELHALYAAAVRNILLILAVPAAVIVLFGPELLRLWLGDSFARESGRALQILAAGVLINGLAHVPSAFLAAVGRPDVSAKFHVLELLIHVPLAYWLIRSFGISGAATAWTLRVTLDALLLFGAGSRLIGSSNARGFARAIATDSAAST